LRDDLCLTAETMERVCRAAETPRQKPRLDAADLLRLLVVLVLIDLGQLSVGIFLRNHDELTLEGACSYRLRAGSCSAWWRASASAENSRVSGQ